MPTGKTGDTMPHRPSTQSEEQILRRHHKQPADNATVSPAVTMPTVELAAELAAILASCNEHLLDLHKQATEIAFAEAAAVQAAWLKTVSAVAELLPHASDRANMTRMIEIVDAWLQVVTQTQTALIGLIGHAAIADSQTSVTPASARPATIERRKLAVVIDFPDRRRTGLRL
jgi:hypothetical protein